jgi:hypothetical protein
MGLIIGPTPWWQEELVARTPEGEALPDGSRIICKAGGTAWIVAPACTQVGGQSWNGTTDTLVGDQCCVSSWATVCSQLISCCFNPDDWFVPSISQIQNPGWVCRTKWDSYANDCYWSSTEISATNANGILFGGAGIVRDISKTAASYISVRVFRCVTY